MYQAKATVQDACNDDEELVWGAAVIIGTLLIHSAPSLELFDFGSTHTFTAKAFVYRIGVSVEDLSYNLVVLTLARVILTIRVCVKGVVIDIQQHILLTDLTMLSMKEYDVSFNMDRMT